MSSQERLLQILVSPSMTERLATQQSLISTV